MIISRVERAETSINSVDFGWWKLVISESITLNSNGGLMNLSVQPRMGFRPLGVTTADSSARTTVVPTATTRLPEALAVINPHTLNSNFLFKDLAGVGVSFKLAQALVKKIDSSKGESLKWILDLVAIGTIADCVPLVGENRVLVKYGLIVLSKTKRSGLLEMFKVGRINVSENNIPNAQTVSFQIAPRINAAGRMDHANVAYNLLIEKTAILARDMALELEIRNQERQKITTEIAREVEILATNSFKEKQFIFAMSEHWSVGILGLVAGKITEKFQKPCALFQIQADQLAGSFRSISQVNVIQIIEKCSDLLIKFGGHSQAAGVSLKKENAEKFYSKMTIFMIVSIILLGLFVTLFILFKQ